MTAQIPEQLILDGEETSMAFCPDLPEGDPRIEERRLERLPIDAPDAVLGSTACWRRYQGTWEIRDGRFYLVDIRGCFRLREGVPILADWFSGILRVPRGEMLQYVHMGFGSVYEQEVHIKIEEGLVVATRVIDNRGKDFDAQDLKWNNLPGGENRFPGDDEL